MSQTGAIGEYAGITPIHQRRSGKRGGLSETSATAEHIGITTLRQRSSRQSRCLSETGATAEHAAITTLRQRSSGKGGGLSKGSATNEHSYITIKRHRRMLPSLHSCIVQKCLDIAIASNICSINYPWGITTFIFVIITNLRIPSASQI